MEEWIKEYWLKTLFGFLIGGFGYWGKKKIKDLECKLKEQDAVRLGVQALLRNDIRCAYKECVAKGYCTNDDMENIEDMYKPYHLLGGNGSATRLIEKLKLMPTEKEN